MMKFTDVQKKAIKGSGDKNMCVSAGAGSGKTMVLVERFVNRVAEAGLSPDEVLAITFTEKAANEMKARAIDLFRKRGMEPQARMIENGYISTIHGFCSRVLKENPIEAGVDPDFNIIESEAAAAAMEGILDDVIEESFADEGVRGFLADYSTGMRDELKEGLKSLYTGMRVCGISFEEMFAQNQCQALARVDTKLVSDTEPSGDKGKALSMCVDALEGITRLDGAKAAEALGKRIEAARAILDLLKGMSKGDEATWEDLAGLRAAAKTLDARVKAIKDDVDAFRRALEDYCGAVKDEMAAGPLKILKTLAILFEQRFYSWKKEHACLDFDDLQLKALGLFSRDDDIGAAILERYKKKLRYIMVDEFQDTNPLQNRLIDRLRAKDNLFIVGDVKQAIYGFRGAEPGLLHKKQLSFDKDKKNSSRLVMNSNFRSRHELVEFINALFERIWGNSEFAFEGLESDAGVNALFSKSSCPVVEMLVAKRSNNPDLKESLNDLRVKEAALVAGRIRGIVEEERFEIYDKKEEALRPVQYRDITILLRTMTSSGIYERGLKDADVPYFTVSGREFYGQKEVVDVISLMQAIERPHFDVPFCAVLKSPIVGLSDDGLYRLAQWTKRGNRDRSLYYGLAELEKIEGFSGDDKKRLYGFRDIWNDLLVNKDRLKISEFVERILDLTLYECTVLSGRFRKQRYANIMKLKELAVEFERNEAMRLGDFIAYVGELRSSEAEESEAQVELEEGDVVKIMTIHKAKGLEFPVVVLGDLASQKMARTSGCFLFDEASGVGLRLRNGVTNGFEPTTNYLKIKERVDVREADEFKRLFYVAATRARERLILAGSIKSFDVKNDSLEKAGSYMSWLKILFGLNEKMSDGMTFDFAGSSVRFYTASERPRAEMKKNRVCMAEDGRFHDKMLAGEPIETGGLAGPDVMKKMLCERDRIMAAARTVRKPYPETTDASASYLSSFPRCPKAFFYAYSMGMSVGLDYKRKEEGGDDEAGAISRRELGNIVHKILELYDYRSKDAAAQVERLADRVAKGLGDDVKQKSAELAAAFIASDEGAAVCRAKDSHREYPFILKFPHGTVRGIIDLLYRDSKGRWCVVDYKNNDITGEMVEKKSDEYELQMIIYALAVKAMTKTLPERCVLYFTEPKVAYSASMDEGDLEEKRQLIDLYLSQISNEEFEPCPGGHCRFCRGRQLCKESI